MAPSNALERTVPRASGREFDLVVYGATGYTGRVVVEYLVGLRERETRGLKWAIAGRNADKLAEVLHSTGASASTPVLVADAADGDALAALAARTRVILTTAGPYQLHGAPLLGACVACGTDYVDLCGEPVWMRAMIDRFDAAARDSGARIVFSCGFDSIPFDIGVWHLQQLALGSFGTPCRDVEARVRELRGSLSGGTLASLGATRDASRDARVAALMRDPFALTPGFAGPDQPADDQPRFDERNDTWLAPFLMAPINSKNVHRSNLLLEHAYGTDFRYSEMLVTGRGERGEWIARSIAADSPLLRRDAARPGAGPSVEERERGRYEILFIGRTPDGRVLRTSVAGDRDPGYGSTSMMVVQSALCLLTGEVHKGGGLWTPAAALAPSLVGRLTADAGLTISIDPA